MSSRSTIILTILTLFLIYNNMLLNRSDAQESSVRGNMIFINPDGASLNHWAAGRIYWVGPDDYLNWDQLPAVSIYRGHLTDQLVSTSNGATTTHAFGYKVSGIHSYGEDNGRPIEALSGYNGSIMREAANEGYPIGILNDGSVSEPGTGVFLSEVPRRGINQQVVAQFFDGRSHTNDTLPAIILGGGERYFLPEGTPYCTDYIMPDCAVHSPVFEGDNPTRDDGRNLIHEATELDYVVIRTRQQYQELMETLAANENYAPRVLGLFAASAIFNPAPEEKLIDMGLINDDNINTREGRLILWGSPPNTLGHNPPNAAELMSLALTILDRRSQAAGKPFFLVAENESNDNFGNEANAIGILNAVKRADDLIHVAQDYVANNPQTMILVTADSDAGGPQVFSPPPLDEDGRVSTTEGHPTDVDFVDADNEFPLDGIEGYSTAPFIAEEDTFGYMMPFAIGWSGTSDVSGAVLARAGGLNANIMRTEFNMNIDNTDIYRIMYLTLFGELLPSSTGQRAPSRQG